MLPSIAPRRSLSSSARCSPFRCDFDGRTHVRRTHNGLRHGGWFNDAGRTRMLPNDEAPVRRYADVGLALMLPEGTSRAGRDLAPGECMRASRVDRHGCGVRDRDPLSAAGRQACIAATAGVLFVRVAPGLNLHSSRLAPVCLRSPRVRLSALVNPN